MPAISSASKTNSTAESTSPPSVTSVHAPTDSALTVALAAAGRAQSGLA